MKQTKLLLFMGMLTFMLSGCRTAIAIAEYIDKSAPLKMIIHKRDPSTGLTTSEDIDIAVNSDTYKRIMNWGNEHIGGWQSTPVSYHAEIYVGQGDFRLLYTKGNSQVVIAFTDKKGKPRQYIKTIEKGSLDFLSQ